MQTIDRILAEAPAFAGLSDAQLEVVGGCARNVGFEAGQRLFREGDAADTFFILRRGRVALTLHDPRGDLTIETVEGGDAVGWSWLFEPYRWHFDAVAVEPVRAVAIDGACLRGKCDADHELGYALMRRFAGIVIDRLQHTRIRLLDVYGARDRD